MTIGFNRSDIVILEREDYVNEEEDDIDREVAGA